MKPAREGKGKFAKLRDAFKTARAARQTNPTPQNRDVESYLQRARAASILYADLKNGKGLPARSECDTPRRQLEPHHDASPIDPPALRSTYNR